MPLFYFYMNKSQKHWDIFCNVIDNFGDIGVTWRLAKQLSTEYQIPIKLWVDDLHCFKHILPELNPNLDYQTHSNIEIIRWNELTPSTWCAGATIIEAFACELPSSIKLRLEQLTKDVPTWLNLEYLSAEPWIDDIHGLPSIQNNGINKYFFFPGFSEKSGGLIFESDLSDKQIAFRSQPNHRKDVLSTCNIDYQDQKIISVFSYETDALCELVKHFIKSDEPTILLVPIGKSSNSISQTLPFDKTECIANTNVKCGNLIVGFLPMTNQEKFDELLWLSDINIVRGEDSFLRAQWAKKPFIWHIYPQDNQTHIDKLNAFWGRYCADLTPELTSIQNQVNLHFNLDDSDNIVESWSNFVSHYEELLRHAQRWPKSALNGSNLAGRLVEFVKNR